MKISMNFSQSFHFPKDNPQRSAPMENSKNEKEISKK